MPEELKYKNRPLVRCNNEIYYGSPEDEFVVFMQILTFTEGDDPQPEKVNVKLLSNDPTLPPRARIIKESEKTGLYNALDIGSIWLERALSEKK